ncbi:MAG: TrkA family potassium uptake protein [Thauera sp.]|jgi:Trk K+ transport system NAD-binding subunit
MQNLARHHSVFFLILRRLRTPLILLITLFAIAVLGLTLAPGPVVDGRTSYLSFFHAFYFISYTATTIGFGEIPYTFSDQQRLWVMVSIYLSVIGWAYTLGAVFNLLSDRSLRQAIAMQRFVRAVRALREPFYLVCGYGETGRLICQALDRMGLRAVVVELDENKVGELDLHNYALDVPAICADASNPEILKFAGLTHNSCVGVVALTNDDHTNLSIAIAARLLAPRVPALCRAENAATADNMASFGTRHIINPFERFAETLALSLHAPKASQLMGWLTGVPDTEVEQRRDPPHGQWIVCGHGRFGRQLVEAMDSEAVPVTIIDLDPKPDGVHRWVEGDGTGAGSLREAGVETATGIVCGTSSDADNLSIAVTARELNPELFVILRQNHESNRALFDAFKADITVVPSRVIGHECIAILSTPLVAPFLEDVRKRDEDWCGAQLERLTRHLGWTVPETRSERINLSRAPALYRRLMRGETITLERLLRSPSDRSRGLDCEVLYLDRDDDDHLLMPAPGTNIRAGDELLLAGTRAALNDIGLIIANEHTLAYILTGEDLPGGWVWEKFSRRAPGAAPRQLP